MRWLIRSATIGASITALFLASSLLFGSVYRVDALTKTCHGGSTLWGAVEAGCDGASEFASPNHGAEVVHVGYDRAVLVNAVAVVNGQACRILATPTSPQGQQAIAVGQLLEDSPGLRPLLTGTWDSVVTALPPCPAGAAPLDPATLAYSFVHEMAPPSTNPSIAPGHAITGKAAYLEQATTSASRTFDTLLGPLTIDLRATTFTIDWGDATGRDPGPFPSPGGPWPDGPAHHTYTTAGAYTVTLIQAWEATWSVAGQQSATPLTVTSTDQILNFEVRQLQAVRDR